MERAREEGASSFVPVLCCLSVLLFLSISPAFFVRLYSCEFSCVRRFGIRFANLSMSMPIFVDSLVCLSVYPLAYSIRFFVAPSLHLLPHLLLMIAILATTRMMMNITFLMVVKLFVCLLV